MALCDDTTLYGTLRCAKIYNRMALLFHDREDDAGPEVRFFKRSLNIRLVLEFGIRCDTLFYNKVRKLFVDQFFFLWYFWEDRIRYFLRYLTEMTPTFRI